MKVKGTTMMEVMVAILITTSILFFSYHGFSLVNKNISRLTESLRKTSNFQAMYARLRTDMWLSKTARLNDKDLTLTVNDFTVKYHFGDSLLIRTQTGRTDSINMKCMDLKVNNSMFPEEESDTIFSIAFQAVISEDTIPVKLNRETQD